MRSAILASLSLLMAGGAFAQANEEAARGQLFRGDAQAVSVAEVDFLGAAEIAALKQYAAQFDYYAALAVSPGDPAETGSAVALANFHSPAAAQRAALGACNARRTTGEPCVIVSVTTPKGYRARDLTLSAEATAAFEEEYRGASSPKAMAISEATGHFGIGAGAERALSVCNDAAAAEGPRDCRVVIAD
ncbi:5-aminolevulic acid synthase [Roseicyclus sp. F158]|uniref:5-aminolevulic acid synthase n=1 Tax=Tropicimonas omnivorans TaxID=3075590 RepID=A0ABU3DIW4_9RHOB|nr:5-aminolevulic acid synthase [Roseicyclus sp. F158]MDT0683665.1 5-aminolevulic acid synthase [Roseicyclus sp. F158]